MFTKERDPEASQPIRPKWYRSTLYNALVLGMCNFLAPGLWIAINSLGGGGETKPFLVNAANSMTFSLMILSCLFSSVIVKAIGIKYALIVGTIGYIPYAAGLYANNRFGTEWPVFFGAALCGLSGGIFWMAEGAIAISYPEPENKGKFLGWWLSFRVAGQILGGAISLGLNARNSHAGKTVFAVYLVYISLQSFGPVMGLLINPPEKVQRSDGVKVDLRIRGSFVDEMAATARLFFSRKFLLIVPLIFQSIYAQAVTFTFQSLWFSVRARALGSFLSGIISILVGNILGAYLDSNSTSLKKRARYAFIALIALQGACFTWATVLNAEFRRTRPVYDWSDAGFGRAVTLVLLLSAVFQLNYLYLYFIVGELATSPAEVVRIAGVLRATESASQSLSYGLNSLKIFAEIGGSSINFGLWGVCIFPAWVVVRGLGTREPKGESCAGSDVGAALKEKTDTAI